jgi:hypothetical protein
MIFYYFLYDIFEAERLFQVNDPNLVAQFPFSHISELDINVDLKTAA